VKYNVVIFLESCLFMNTYWTKTSTRPENAIAK
jgi:hypothetical protein